MRNNTPRGDAGQMVTPTDEPIRTVTTSGHQSLLTSERPTIDVDDVEGELGRVGHELAALNASEKNKTTATRASRPAEDSPEYRETVAEYYRRLGNDGGKANEVK